LLTAKKKERAMVGPTACFSIIKRHSQNLAKDSSGATAIEYAIIAGGIAGAIIVTVAALGTRVLSLYESVAVVL